MFTGLIEKVGLHEGLRKGRTYRLTVKHDPWPDSLAVGESVAVQGACLTVVRFGESFFECDLLEETIQKTTLGVLKRGCLLNLERALRMGDRLGGHFVLGHVDGIGRLKKLSLKGADRILEIECGHELAKDIVSKGSIAVDGISLTVVNAEKSCFSVHVTSHTWQNTSLKERKNGDPMNIETDILAKICRMSVEGTVRTDGGISERFLKDAGF